MTCKETGKLNKEKTIKDIADLNTVDSAKPEPLTYEMIKEKFKIEDNLFDNWYNETNVPNKMVLGKEFYYNWPRYRYDDLSGNWYIIERPQNVFTYRYNEKAKNIGFAHKAFKVEFIEDNKLLKSLDLIKTNPYFQPENAKYKGYGKADEGGEEAWYAYLSDTAQIDLLTVSDNYYITSDVTEHGEDYTIVDYVMVGRASDLSFIGEKHTFVIYSNKGEELGRVKDINGLVGGEGIILSRDKQHLIYTIGNDVEMINSGLIIYDIINNEEVYNNLNEQKTDRYMPGIGVYEEESTDKLYYCISINTLDENGRLLCKISNIYIDLDARKLLKSCLSIEEYESYTLFERESSILSNHISNVYNF